MGETYPAPFSIEYHLIKRSRKSVTWANTQNPYDTTWGTPEIIHKQSVIDGSHLAVFSDDPLTVQNWLETWYEDHRGRAPPFVGSVRERLRLTQTAIIPKVQCSAILLSP